MKQLVKKKMMKDLMMIKKMFIKISMTDHELRPKALHNIVKTLSIDKFQVEMPIDNCTNLTGDSMVKSIMGFFINLSNKRHSSLMMRKLSKQKEQAKATMALVESSTPINLPQSKKKRQGTQVGSEAIESLSSSEGEKEFNSKPFNVVAEPVLRGVNLRKWIVLNTKDYYINSISLTDQGNKKRSIQKEPRVLTESLQKVLKLVKGFQRYELGWMTSPLWNYGPELVQKCYANFQAMLKNMTPLEKDMKKQP